MSFKNPISIIVLILVIGNSAQGQEIVRGLQKNREIQTYKDDPLYLKTKGISDTLELPFFDDFSNSSVFPWDSLWSDNDVFINNTYAVDQLSFGVATFDLIDNKGLLYEHATTNLFKADQLTSNPINLEGDASDNFFLSFFYQPQGIADEPAPSDSLTLQFYSVSEAEWFSVWKAYGTNLHPFKPVIIKVDDPRFTSKGFRFRFTNYGTLDYLVDQESMAGNADQWHLDYVYLDRNRNDSDTLLHDVAFTRPVRSVLNNYEAIPWSQFKDWSVSVLGPSVIMHYVNNDDIIRNITRSYSIRDVYEDQLVHSFTPLARNVQPGERETYEALLTYTFNSTTEDSALFEITSTLITDIFDIKVNDTIRYLQSFKNYFAVDDGTSEAGYDIGGPGTNNGMVVYRYRSLSADTLRAINICFNDSYLNANQRLFDLVILGSDNQSPGDLIYAQEEEMVDPGESIDGFVSYKLNEPVPVEGYFFVGWRKRSTTWLNGGFDLNTPHNGRQFYYQSGIWYTSSVNGSVMVRPVVGKPLLSTGIENAPSSVNNLKIWPNPANDIINIAIDDIDLINSRVEIYDVSGRKMEVTLQEKRVDISQLPEGVYFIVILKDNFVFSRNKFIKTRY